MHEILKYQINDAVYKNEDWKYVAQIFVIELFIIYETHMKSCTS